MTDEYCVNGNAFSELSLPSDRIIQKLVDIGKHTPKLTIDSKLWKEFKDQMGDEWTENIVLHSPWGQTIITEEK